MPKQIVTQKRLKELFNYDPITGDFTRLVRTARRVQIGDIAGHRRSDGYLIIIIDYRYYLAHRLAFLYMAGKFPTDQADHINHIRHDNRWVNLREATNTTNRRNQSMPCDNTSGVMGVSWYKRDRKWHARIQIKGKTKHLGYFTDIEGAVAARKEAEIKYGFHKNHGLAGH